MTENGDEITIYQINDTAERLEFPTTYENNALERRVSKIKYE